MRNLLVSNDKKRHSVTRGKPSRQSVLKDSQKENKVSRNLKNDTAKHVSRIRGPTPPASAINVS